jgi:hypothetical protein
MLGKVVVRFAANRAYRPTRAIDGRRAAGSARGVKSMSTEADMPARQIHASRREVKLRNRYPYGFWTCPDGRQVLFDRNYKPVWQRYPGQSATPADPNEWVSWSKQEWFFDDGSPPWERPVNGAVKKVVAHCEAVLAEWGIQDAPPRGTFVRVS